MTPKAIFQLSAEDVERVRKFIKNPDNLRAMQMALNEYQVSLANREDNPAAKFSMLQGAQEYVALLYRMSDKPTKPALVDRLNLNHHA